MGQISIRVMGKRKVQQIPGRVWEHLLMCYRDPKKPRPATAPKLASTGNSEPLTPKP